MMKTESKKVKRTIKKMPVSKRGEYIDPNTGELVDRYEFKFEDRDFDFHKLWLWHIATALELIGNQKIKILTYILENIDVNNKFIGTQQELAKNTETSIQTVTFTMKMLMEGDIIKMLHPSVYQINPEIIFKGSSSNRMEVLYTYNNTKSKEKKHKNKKDKGEKKS